MIEIYTDGSARKNPGPGGYGVVILQNGNLIDVYSHQEEYTTNNRQEMKAILYALCRYGKSDAIVYADSAYAINVFNDWMYNWSRNNWKKSDNQTPENLDIVKEYYKLITSYHFALKFIQVRGHTGIKWNEIADQLATGKISCNEVMKKYGK